MLRYFGLLRRVMDPYFASHGISGSQWGVLRVLRRAQRDGNSGVRLMDLGQRLLVRPPSVTGVVHRLTRMGLVKTTASTQDQRVRLVSLTPKGIAVVDTLSRGHSQRVRDIYAVLDDTDLAGLNRSLSRLCWHMERMEKISRATGEKDDA